MKSNLTPQEIVRRLTALKLMGYDVSCTVSQKGVTISVRKHADN